MQSLGGMQLSLQAAVKAVVCAFMVASLRDGVLMACGIRDNTEHRSTMEEAYPGSAVGAGETNLSGCGSLVRARQVFGLQSVNPVQQPDMRLTAASLESLEFAGFSLQLLV